MFILFSTLVPGCLFWLKKVCPEIILKTNKRILLAMPVLQLSWSSSLRDLRSAWTVSCSGPAWWRQPWQHVGCPQAAGGGRWGRSAGASPEDLQDQAEHNKCIISRMQKHLEKFNLYNNYFEKSLSSLSASLRRQWTSGSFIIDYHCWSKQDNTLSCHRDLIRSNWEWDRCSLPTSTIVSFQSISMLSSLYRPEECWGTLVDQLKLCSSAALLGMCTDMLVLPGTRVQS